MTIRAVIFDFSGTLFRLEHPDLPPESAIMRALTAPVGVAEGLSPEMRDAWERRDLDPALHRAANVSALLTAGLTPEAAERTYDQLCSPECWEPYPDTAEALAALTARDVPVGLLSNTAWNVRTVFDRHGLRQHLDASVLSFEEGLLKPDPVIFELACARLGVDPAETLMVGDSAEADGGAAAIGCAVALVDPVAVGTRPDALLTVLREHELLDR
ncbi:HAD family hydrolase [Umezawaea beigongshangensis]|uniref:HAD family hydrolase n=1 Tax=Umezawaea beigongshangensis TaxID=2780383 RepID=UPI0018F22C3B|nr:HAD family hydrolase [Umezawaea beigongshangensis]